MMREPSIPIAMRPLLGSFHQILHKIEMVRGFMLQPVDLEGPDVAKGLAEFLKGEGKRVAIVEPGTREIAAKDLAADIIQAAQDKAIDIVLVIGSDNPPPSIHLGFRLLNQARDRIVKELRRPLLWCGPGSFLVMTQGEAPDFWSIRMIDVFVRPDVESTPGAEIVKSGSPEIIQHRADYREAQRQGNADITAYAAKTFVECLLAENLLDEAARVIAEVLPDVRDGADVDTLGELLRVSARLDRARGDDMSAAATLGALVARADVGAYMRIRAQLDLAKLLEDAGHLDSAERAYREALTLARSISDIETEAQSLIGAYGIAARTGRGNEAEKPLADAAELARRVGNQSLLASALAAQSLLALGSFDSPKAERKLDEARYELSRVASRADSSTKTSASITTPVDIVIFTAVKAELDAVLAIGNDWQELRDLAGFRYFRREVHRSQGSQDSFIIAAAWIGEMGGRSTAIRAQQLLTELDPSCLAMCGICAGDRDKVALGDIIVADRLFAWDEGKRIVEPGKEDKFYHALRSFDLEATWRMDLAFLADEMDLARLSKDRPPSKSAQRNWFLFTLSAFEAGQGPAPAVHPERKSHCPHWTVVFDGLLADALITLADAGRLSLSPEGRKVVAREQMRYPDGLPPDPPLRVHVGAMATVSAVIEDPGIFKRMQHVVRSTYGLEMEGAALGEVAQRFHKRAILVKAVQDFADGSKDDAFRAFGCRASAEFLFAFLEKHFEPERDNRHNDKRLEMREFDPDPEHPFLAKVERAASARFPTARITKHRVEPPFVGLLQLDIETSGFSETQLVVALDQTITPDLVQRFAILERPFRDDYPPLRSTIVYRGDIAPHDLTAEARRKGIHLETFYAYQALFDLTKYLEWQTARLQADPIYPPAMYVDPPATYEVQGSRERTRIENALNYLLDLLRSPEQPRFALVIGEFGAGKTFLLHELARRMVLDKPKHPVWPVLVEMHRLEKQTDLPALIAAHFSVADVPGYNFKAFQYMLNEGRIALLFDGFDELAGHVTYDAVTRHFDTVLSAAQGERAKVVLSSRRQHFLSDNQMKDGVQQAQIKLVLADQAAKVPGFHLVMLEKFEPLQIRQYLHNVLGDQRQADERYALIDEVKDLLGLSHNPRMLGFIARIPEGSLREAKRKEGTITAAGLYDLLVKEWLDFEHQRSLRISVRKGISREALRQGIGALALSMWQSRIKQVQLDQIRDVVAAAMVELKEPPLDPNVLAQMFGSGSLLVRDAEGRFSFVHRSVMEWFVAREAAMQVRDHDDSALLAADELSPLMADFFTAMAMREKAIAWARGKLITREKGPLAKNATLVLQRLGESLKSLDFAGQDLRGQDFSGVDWRGADLRGANLEGATLVGADLSGANLEGTRLYRANLMKAKLVGARLGAADLRVARLLGADLTDAEGLDSVELFRTNFAGATVPEGFNPSFLDPFGAPAVVRETEHMRAPDAADCYSVVYDCTGELLAGGCNDGTVRIFDAVSGELLRVLRRHTDMVWSVAFSPDGKTIVSAVNDKTLRLWDVSSGRFLRVLKGHTDSVRSVAFSPDGKTIASGSSDKTLRVWDVTSGQSLRTLEGHTHWLMSVAFSPDGKTIVSGSSDETLRLWDVTSGRCLRAFEGLAQVAFSPDGKTIVSGSEDNTLHLWDVTSGRRIRVLQGHSQFVWSVAFSPDGNTIASSSADSTIRLWDVTSGRSLGTFIGHRNAVWSVAFSPDGKTIASGSSDSTIRLWDVTTGRCIRVIDSSATAPWYVVNLCRFEPGDIEEFLPHLRVRADEPV